MSSSSPESRAVRRVLIASANPLFGKGLQNLLTRRDDAIQIRLAQSMKETLDALSDWQPDLVIVDYDDQTIDRGKFLGHFVSEERPMQVMLVSLRASGAVVVYDRKTLTPDQAEDWLSMSWPSEAAKPPPVEPETPKPVRSKPMKHFFVVAGLVIVFTILTNFILQNIGLLPIQASAQAATVDQLFNVHFWVISFLLSLILVLLGYSLVVFRQKPGDDEDGPPVKGSTRLELFWTLIPLVTVIYFSYLGAQSLAEVRRVDPQAMEVKVTAGSWFWRYEYPDYGITTNSLYLPVDRQVLLKMTSIDVIHSFWVPEFRVKQDILPGENLVRELRFTPTEIGEYTVLCAELCGGAHAYMTSPVIVMKQEDFNAWVSQEMAAVSPDPATRGERLAAVNGCIACHSLDGEKSIGPTWKGAFGSEHTLTDGSVVLVDEAYLRAGIIDPSAQVPEGYPPNVMPQTYGNTLNDQQIADIIEYIKSLR